MTLAIPWALLLLVPLALLALREVRARHGACGCARCR